MKLYSMKFIAHGFMPMTDRLQMILGPVQGVEDFQRLMVTTRALVRLKGLPLLAAGMGYRSRLRSKKNKFLLPKKLTKRVFYTTIVV